MTPSLFLQHPVLEDVDDVLEGLVGVAAEMVRHAEQDLHGVVLQEEAARHHDGRQWRHALAELIERHAVAVLIQERLEPAGHVGVELPDVAAVELDHVHIDQRDVGTILLDAGARRTRQGLEIVRERALRERLVEREVGRGQCVPVLVQQRPEQALLVRKLVVHVAGGHPGRLGDVAHAGAVISNGREQPERGFENVRAAAFGAGFLVHADLVQRAPGG